MNVRILDDAAAVAHAASDIVIDEMRARRGKLLLSGADVARRTYQRIAKQAQPADYKGVHLFFGDERTVPPDHVESTYAMVRRNWLEPVRFPTERVHRIMGELEPDRAARLAEEELRSVAGQTPALDVAILGLGAKGATSALFLGSAALEETERLFAPSYTLRRVTATITLINACRTIIFLAVGADRADSVQAALCEPPGSVPASLVGSPENPPIWLLDRSAAALI